MKSCCYCGKYIVDTNSFNRYHLDIEANQYSLYLFCNIGHADLFSHSMEGKLIIVNSNGLTQEEQSEWDHIEEQKRQRAEAEKMTLQRRQNNEKWKFRTDEFGTEQGYFDDLTDSIS
jgi:hypothetical protein